MRRHYYISDDLDDLEVIEKELEKSGLSTTQIHVLSNDDAGVEAHHLHNVPSLLKKDIVHSTTIAAMFGFVCAVGVLCVAYYTDVTGTVGWIPFIFLALIVMGFITWEGGMWGIQETNIHFKRFEQILSQGNHVLYIEVTKGQELLLNSVIDRHHKLLRAGIENCY